MLMKTATVGSRIGLHARPATLLAERVQDKGVEIEIAKVGDDDFVDASSILMILSLGVTHGDTVTIRSSDATIEQIEEIATLIESDLDAE
ncbi:MAG: HPr family phosphocarrier protein [Actinomycetota bacterium]|nr:HPr family phosphocarrier protein [Actinomycetota bacterium]